MLETKSTGGGGARAAGGGNREQWSRTSVKRINPALRGGVAHGVFT